jgi:hypothetical protein
MLKKLFLIVPAVMLAVSMLACGFSVNLGNQPAPTAMPPAAAATQPVTCDQNFGGIGSCDSPTAAPAVAQNPGACTFSAPGNLDAMPKVRIDKAQLDTWFHNVFNESLFVAPGWNGADSWFESLALGPNSGGSWKSMGNPGQVVYRGTSTHISWCLGILTTSQWKSQFMDGSAAANAAINVRIAPESVVTVTTASGKTVQQATSDMGDITIILPDSGVVTISVDYTTAAPTHESFVWLGPYDRSKGINTVDAR